MRRNTWIGILVAVACVLVSASFASANIRMHDFDCKECHTASLAVNSVDNNVCLKCHTNTMPPVNSFADPARNGATAHTMFAGGDASDRFGSVTAKGVTPGNQSSHFWAGTSTNPEAGAQEPTTFFSATLQRPLSYSRGAVTCSRCHDPHGYYDTNPQILMSTSLSTPTKDPLCLDCHRAWNSATTHGRTTHPINVDLAAAASSQPSKYNAAPVNIANSNVTLDAAGKVTCSSCHGVHGTDSNAATVDSVNSAAPGDGLLLKHNGPMTETPTTSICQSCHKYKGHGNATLGSPIGCLVCHGGHEYDAAGNPNVFMLKKQITLDTTAIRAAGTTSDTVNLDYTAYPAPTNYDNGTGNGGLCLSCHDYPAGHPAQASANCADCHNHDASNGSFGPGCGSCHGFAPSVNADGSTTQGGWAHSTTNPANNYNGAKDESQTPHATHANGAGNYTYSCDECHGTGSGPSQATHDQGSFQNVFQLADGGVAGLPALPKTGGAVPNYAVAGAGTCSATYCHSNGNPIGGTLQTTSVTWDLGKGTIFTPANTTDNECQQCHGNTAVTMNGKNSALHQQHLGTGTMLGKTFDCSVCHSTVAVSNTELQAAAIGGDHVNGSKDVSFNGAFSLGVGTLGGGSYGAATCSVYCHSNGKVGGESAPNWTTPASGQCGTCHQVNATGDTGASLTGAHAKHVFDANGPQLSCNDCHGAGAASGTHANHINGGIDAPAQAVCNACHGAVASQTAGPDREPIWTDATSVDCETCHTGSAIAVVKTKTAPAQNSFGTLGHGKASITGPTCTGCHDTSAGKHFDAASGDPQLSGGATVVANDAFCQTCHGPKAAHFTATVSTNANNCSFCHEPHGNGVGAGFDAMLLSSVGPTGAKAPVAVTGFTDKTVASSYWNAGNTGICQVCHNPAGGTGGINHYNRTTADGHNSTTVCTTCHNHNDATVAFKASATTCEGCHAGTMASNGHPAHVNKNGGIIDADKSDCAACHGAQVNGADPYTLTGGGGGLHQDGTVDFAAGIADGGVTPAVTCTSACHNQPSGLTAVWNSGTIACDACHGQPPADGGGDGLAHSKHVALTGVDCTTCHGGPMPTDQAHVTQGTGTDLAILQNMTVAQPNEANIAEASWNATNNTCNNAACHNPSGDAHLADWDTSTSTGNCVLCHGGLPASGDPIASNAHASHINNAGEIGDNIDCFQCHVDTTAGGTNVAHRNNVVDIITNADPTIGLGYNGDTGVGAPYGSCNSKICHTEGGNAPGGPNVGSIIASPAWDGAGFNCTTCHVDTGNPPAAGNPYPPSGDHAAHMGATRVSNGMSCTTCHTNTAASNTSIKAGGNHINGNWNDFAPGGNYSGAPVTVGTFAPGVPSTCDNVSCHSAGGIRTWQQASGCASCHGDLSYVGATHTAHIDITGSIDADVSECVICHGPDINTYTVSGGDGGSGNHQNGSIQLAAGISAAAGGCASACHGSSAADGFWADANGLNCTACHNNGTNDNNIANAAPATGAHAGHVTTESLTCDNCHSVGTTLPTDTSHISGLNASGAAGANQGETLTNKATPVADNATVDDSSFDQAGNTFDDVNNTCSNTYCHDPSNSTQSADWDTDAASCVLCHGDDAGPDQMATGTHGNHLNATATFGLTITCDKCHPDNTGNYGHFIATTGPTTVNQAVQFAGTVITAAGTGNGKYSGEVGLPDSGFGTCGTTACHNNGQGAAPNNPTYTWGTTNILNCLLCHNDLPTTGAHATHLDMNIKYGPYAKAGGSTNCGKCHAANANNSSMGGQATHINGTISFAGGNEVASGGINGDTTVTACDTCHGGTAAVNLAATGAKAKWSAGGPVACESCHGDYNQADVDGALAPTRAGAAYDNNGHGKTGVAKACVDCHDHAGDHIGFLTNRLNTIGGKDYNVDPNGFCNACHTGVPNSAVHFANSQTAGGTSSDAVLCVTCHDQHGQNGGQDAMIASTIQTRTVSGFTDKTLRASYANASNQGVCQVCHDPAEVLHFNRTSSDTELGSHNAGQICTTCHSHSDTPIFKPSGCNGCHGGGTTGANASNYWPDGSNANAENTAGRHLKHMNVLAQRVYGMSAVALLDQPTADAAQKALCEYCHAATTNDSDHGSTANLPAEVFVDADSNRHAKTLWGSADASATYVGGSCNTVACHNGKNTGTATYGWANSGTSTCTMCHTTGGTGSNPSTGLHTVVNNPTEVQVHDNTLGTGCTECHNALPAIGNTAGSTHINGTFVADSALNDDRGITVSGNITAFNQAAVGTEDSCASNCHSDAGTWQRLWSTAADSTSNAVGAPRCNVCHGYLNNWRTGMTPDHSTKTAINNGTHGNCSTCHVRPNAPYAVASYHDTSSALGTPTELGAPGHAVEMNDTVGYDMANGNCTNTCHTNDVAHTLGNSAHFPANGLAGPGADCNTCHLATGGSNNTNTVGSYTFNNRTGAHAKHAASAATAYGDTVDHSTAANYDFGCGLCHPANSSNHQNGTLDLILVPTDAPASIKGKNDPSAVYSGGSCSAVYCHSDGVNVAAGSSPDYLTGSFSNPNGDYCQNCHGNQPTTGSHPKHAIGIHSDDVYTGSTGKLAEAGASGAGHGDINTALTITCAVCHNSTVTQWFNGNNSACVSCHGTAGVATDKTVITSADLDKSFHVNGTKDVVFAPVNPLRSKAQVRDFTPGEPELNNTWTRTNGYKAGATSHDAGTALNTATMWTGGTKNCTVTCHNGNPATWGSTGNSCDLCHTQLPK